MLKAASGPRSKNIDRDRAAREEAAAPTPKPPTAKTVAKTRSYWHRDEPAPIANPLSRAPYSEVRARAAASRPNVPPAKPEVEKAAPEPKPVKPVPTDDRVRTYFSRGHQKA